MNILRSSPYILLIVILTSCQPAKTIPPATSEPATATLSPASTTTIAPTQTPFHFEELPEKTWVKLRGMPTARSETHAVELNGKIYVAGGFKNGGITSWHSSNTLEVFDPVLNEWGSLKNMPRKLNHHQTAAHDEKIYVFGGYPELNCCEADGSSWVYDPAADVWKSIAPMPDSRAGGMAVSLGKYIYVVGGTSSIFRQEPISDLLRYDPAADLWEEMSPLLIQRDHVAAVSYDGKIYAFAGRIIQDYKSMEIYDPETDIWTMGPDMRTPRAGHGAAVIGDLIFIAGGEQVGVFPEQIVTTVEVYNPQTNSWLGDFDLPIGLHGVPVAGVDGVLFLVGGSSKANSVSNNGQVWAWRVPDPFP